MKYATNLNLDQNELQNAIAQNLTTEPTSPKKGQFFFDTSVNKLKIFNGTTWEVPGDTVAASSNNGMLSVNGSDVKVYELPKSTGTVLGGIKVGAGLSVTDDGTLSATGGGTADAVEWENVIGRPTALSEFTNDTNFITNTVNNLTNYYAKTETYTKTEVNGLIGNIATIQIKVVESLPETGQSNIIYLVAKSTGEESQNVYDEYLWTGSAYEKIGDTKIDLSNYLTKTGDGSNLTVNGSNLGTKISEFDSDLDSLATVANTGSYNDLLNKPTIPKAVNKDVKTLSTATATYTVSGYIIGVLCIDSVTKEAVITDLTFNGYGTDANNSVIVTCSQAPTNPINVIITYIAA